MFGRKTPSAADRPDPLQSRRTAAIWFERLPALDVIGRQTLVIEAFTQMRDSYVTVDLERVAAIEFVDAALEVDHRRLVKWYFENLQRTARLADRFWDTAHDVAEGFIFAYRAALDAAPADERRWKALLPLIIARLIHFHGVEAKLRLFRNERWTAIKWKGLHQLFVRAAEAGVEREPTALGTDPLAPRSTIEQEYIRVLLLHQLDTGNLTPAELDWASGHLRAWSRDLVFETVPAIADGFFVDLAAGKGLIRRSGSDQGAKVGYLDTTPLVDQLELAVTALRAPDESGDPAADRIRQQQLATLEKMRPAIAPSRQTDLRRHPRVAVDVAANIRVGLSRIALDLAAKSGEGNGAPDQAGDGQGRRPIRSPAGLPGSTPPPTARAPGGNAPVRTVRRVHAQPRDDWSAAKELQAAQPPAGPSATAKALAEAIAARMTDAEEIELHPIAGDLHIATGSQDKLPSTGHHQPKDPVWQVKDRSAAGWRISAPGGVGQVLALGALVAVRATDAGEWMLGVVQRLATGSNNHVEAGMSMIAERVVPVALHGQRQAQDNMGIVVDGIDVSTMGARFDGLYLMPPSRLDTRVAMRTLIIPTAEYADGRSLFLTTARSTYAVKLRHLVDQRSDWSWVTIQVSAKEEREEESDAGR